MEEGDPGASDDDDPPPPFEYPLDDEDDALGASLKM